MVYPVNEIFYSLQGEGFHAGRAAVFIRLAGCNLECPWCDTDHTARICYTAEEIIGVIAYMESTIIEAPSFVVLTGGEPTIHPLEELLTKLKEFGVSLIAIETNGTNTKALEEYKKKKLLDWITISPKSLSTVATSNLEVADEIKIVWDEKNPPSIYEVFIDSILNKGRAYIQPCSQDYKPAVDFVLNNPRWRLSVQTQKIIGVR